MKTNPIFMLLFISLFTTAVFAQKPVHSDDGAQANPPRVTFMLKNTLGYHRMFRVEGPGIAYGFTMNKRETTPCHWPVGSTLYFSQDGETTTGLIFTVSASDEGKTLMTGMGATERKANAPGQAAQKTIRFYLRNASLLPRKVALISYEPGETGNGTRIFTLAPLVGSTSVRFPVGTRLYLASNEQVDVVMSGKRIDSDKPFLTVQASNAGKTIILP